MNIDTDPRFEKANRCWCNWISDSPSEHSEFYYVCDRCGTHFSKFRLKKEEIAEFYSYQEYWQDRQKIKSHPTLEERGDVLVSDGRIQLWKETINRYLPDTGKTALEIGCAEASLLVELKNHGWTTIGLEPDPEVARIVRGRTLLDIREGIFPDTRIDGVDLVVACDVLEHSVDPRSFLEAVSSSLNPEGIILIQLPILESQVGFADMNSRVFDPEEHAFIYTRESIATLLGTTGFEVLENENAWSIAHEIVVARKAPQVETTGPKLLANLTDTFSLQYTEFINQLNAFAAPIGLRQFSNWSKIWEYPRIWYDQFYKLDFQNINILDLGSEQSPWPWFLASKGARVTIVETSENWLEQWQAIREKLNVEVSWHIVDGCFLPFEDDSYDAVTSFSVLEHQNDKRLAISEMVRVLKPDGLLGLSCDLVIGGYGMTYPEWNGQAWSLAEFQKELLEWDSLITDSHLVHNKEDVSSFLNWHRTTAPHHNYTCGAAVFRKQGQIAK